jgi:hypothetical protein
VRSRTSSESLIWVDSDSSRQASCRPTAAVYCDHVDVPAEEALLERGVDLVARMSTSEVNESDLPLAYARRRSSTHFVVEIHGEKTSAEESVAGWHPAHFDHGKETQ